MNETRPEILAPETSNEELFDVLHDIKTDGGRSSSHSAGNIADPFVRKSLNAVGEALEGREDWSLIGGIPAQTEVVRRLGYDSPRVMQYFGRRVTNDLDILTTDTVGVKNEILSAGYDESELLDIDTIGSGLIDHTEDIIENSEAHRYAAYADADVPLNTVVRVPSDTDLFYSKIHDQASRESSGTSSDAEIIATSGLFDIEDERLDYLLAGNPGAQEYAEELGY